MKNLTLASICFTLFMFGCSGGAGVGRTPTPSPSASPIEIGSNVSTPSPSPAAKTTEPSSTADFSKMDPYSDSLDNFLPEKFMIGKEMWVRTGPSASDSQVPCTGGARGAHYGFGPIEDGEHTKRIYMNVGNCGSTAAAETGIQKLEKQNNVVATARRKGAAKGGKMINIVTAKSAVFNNGSIIVGLTTNGKADNNDIKRFMNALPF
jgi:hypothetical protein